MFPKIVGFPPKSPIFNMGFPLFSPSILGYIPYFWETPIYELKPLGVQSDYCLNNDPFQEDHFFFVVGLF